MLRNAARRIATPGGQHAFLERADAFYRQHPLSFYNIPPKSVKFEVCPRRLRPRIDHPHASPWGSLVHVTPWTVVHWACAGPQGNGEPKPNSYKPPPEPHQVNQMVWLKEQPRCSSEPRNEDFDRYVEWLGDISEEYLSHLISNIDAYPTLKDAIAARRQDQPYDGDEATHLGALLKSAVIPLKPHNVQRSDYSSNTASGISPFGTPSHTGQMQWGSPPQQNSSYAPFGSNSNNAYSLGYSNFQQMSPFGTNSDNPYSSRTSNFQQNSTSPSASTYTPDLVSVLLKKNVYGKANYTPTYFLNEHDKMVFRELGLVRSRLPIYDSIGQLLPPTEPNPVGWRDVVSCETELMPYVSAAGRIGLSLHFKSITILQKGPKRETKEKFFS